MKRPLADIRRCRSLTIEGRHTPLSRISLVLDSARTLPWKKAAVDTTTRGMFKAGIYPQSPWGDHYGVFRSLSLYIYSNIAFISLPIFTEFVSTLDAVSPMLHLSLNCVLGLTVRRFPQRVTVDDA